LKDKKQKNSKSYEIRFSNDNIIITVVRTKIRKILCEKLRHEINQLKSRGRRDAGRRSKIVE
jgi:hypothetical protein